MPSHVPHRLTHSDPSREYRARVDGKEIYVFNQPGFAGGTISWIYLDLAGPAQIEVTPHRLVDHVRVLPRRADRKVRLENNTASLEIDRPGHYLLEWDNILELPFFVIARPPEKSGLAPKGRRLEFGAGRHEAGRIELHSGDELYLAPGAEVFGAIYAKDATNVRICGRGILSQAHLPFGGKDGQHNPIELDHCRDVVIEGIILMQGCTWNVVFRDCDNITARRLSIFSEGPYSTDGINPCDSRDVLIEQCFIRCKDDCISVKGMQRGVPPEQLKPIHKIEVRDCFFWSDNNNGLVVGTETWASEIFDVKFHRIDFVRVSGSCGDWAAAFAVQALADTYIHDIVFEDIELEYCTGNPFAVFYLDTVYGIPGERRPSGGRIESITFHNITFHNHVQRRCFIQGRDTQRQVVGVAFSELSVAGKPIQSAADFRLITNEFAKDIRFA